MMLYIASKQAHESLAAAMNLSDINGLVLLELIVTKTHFNFKL